MMNTNKKFKKSTIMPNKNKLIPFKLCPASWGLKGKSYLRAKAEYELDGYDLDVALADIDCEGEELMKKISEIQLKHGLKDQYQHDADIAMLTYIGKKQDKRLLEINLAHNKITAEEFDRLFKKLDYTEDQEKEIKLVDIEVDFKYGKINEKEYNKQKATVMGEPWVDIVGIEIDTKNINGGGAFQLDWNDAWVDELRKNGYTGINPDHVVQRWFDMLCTQVALDSGMLNENEKEQIAIKSKKTDDGRKEYS